MEFSQQLKSIQTGHICLIICCIFYLMWWSITFNPMKSFPSLPKYILFLGITITGMAGLVILIKTMGNLPLVNKSISNAVILFAGIVVYACLLYLTGHFLHRQVTTELLLIIGWTVLELCVLSGTYGAAAISIHAAAAMTVVVIAAAVISLICYLLYYNLEPVTGFFDGMVPLVLFGGVMVVQAIMIKG